MDIKGNINYIASLVDDDDQLLPLYKRYSSVKVSGNVKVIVKQYTNDGDTVDLHRKYISPVIIYKDVLNGNEIPINIQGTWSESDEDVETDLVVQVEDFNMNVFKSLQEASIRFSGKRIHIRGKRPGRHNTHTGWLYYREPYTENMRENINVKK